MAMVGAMDGLRVMDAYAGVGSFGLRMARAGASGITLVEANPSAAADARHNIAVNELRGAEVVEATFGADPLERRPDLLVLDPNRAGLQGPGLQAVHQLRARRILYIACGLRALARDLARLPGYTLTDLRLADLFPHTDHVEVLALLAAR
jgi:tRNA/tmRNA/rRNA uracil-C5-methylase (TrmA/RlmC/RlmD family)